MKQLFLGMVMLCLGFVLMTPVVGAKRGHGDSRGGSDRGGGSDTGRGGSVKGGGTSVPELDPTVTGSAIVLLLGGVAYVASRRRKDDTV